MNLHPVTMPTVQDYARAFDTECSQSYPEVREFEIEHGASLSQDRLEAAAKILACPVKASPPNWQHGRILYSTARRYLATAEGPVRCVDIGTAKGFSALVLQWALNDSGVAGKVESVDVIDPLARVFRNSVLDVGRENRLADYLRSWPEAEAISFYQSTGIDWLSRSKDRVHIAFVDGKHSADVVEKEGTLIANRQVTGDLAVFDDVQMPPVAQAVYRLHDRYVLEAITLSAAKRAYVVGVRR